jgi:ubiquitin-conjugating enzyme E2 variant
MSVEHPVILLGPFLTLPQSVHENRIYSLKIHCGDNYPDTPPDVTFESKINLPCVDPRNGKVRTAAGSQLCPYTKPTQVDPTKLPCLVQWKRDFTMETILIELRR